MITKESKIYIPLIRDHEFYLSNKVTLCNIIQVLGKKRIKGAINMAHLQQISTSHSPFLDRDIFVLDKYAPWDESIPLLQYVFKRYLQDGEKNFIDFAYSLDKASLSRRIS